MPGLQDSLMDEKKKEFEVKNESFFSSGNGW
jgi:hypothetical protein